MGKAIGNSLPLAVGIAVSPVPIIAVVLMLSTDRARLNGLAFVLGWLAGLGVVGLIVLAIAGPAAASRSGAPATWVSWLKITLGALLLLVAVRQFRGRPKADEEASLPKWMGAVDKFKPGAAFGAGALLAGLNPKNLLLAVAGAAAIAQTGIAGGQQALAYLIFAVIATVGVGTPVIIYFAMGKRSADILDELRKWMARYNAVIMSALCLIIAAKLIGDAIGALT
jgi:threonine/homoserine/homoserine lactone efflux protein